MITRLIAALALIAGLSTIPVPAHAEDSSVPTQCPPAPSDLNERVNELEFEVLLLNASLDDEHRQLKQAHKMLANKDKRIVRLRQRLEHLLHKR